MDLSGLDFFYPWTTVFQKGKLFPWIIQWIFWGRPPAVLLQVLQNISSRETSGGVFLRTQIFGTGPAVRSIIIFIFFGTGPDRLGCDWSIEIIYDYIFSNLRKIYLLIRSCDF